MKSKIIVFPASQWQCDLIKYLKRKNYFVYSLDDDNNAVGHNFSNKRLNINSKEIKKIKSFIKRNKCKIISSCSDLGQKLVNKVNNKKNDIFNKFKQREIQKKLFLNTPFYFSYKNYNKKSFIACQKKVVSKPILGSGSNGLNYHKNFKKYKNKNLFYEQFIEGKEFNVDGFVIKNNIYFYAIMEKIKCSRFVSYIMKQNSLKNKIIKDIKLTLKMFILNSKYPDGPFHAEIIVQKKTDKIFIVESHPREAGFNLFYLTCKKITGLDLYQISVKAKLNEKLYLKNIKSKDIFNNYCTRMIPVEKSGIIKKIFLKKFNDKKEIKTYIKIFKKKDDVIENKNNDASRIGYIQSFTNNKKMNLEKYTYKILKKYLTIKYY